MRNIVIAFILATSFLMSCGEKEKKTPSNTQKKVSREKKKPEKNLNVKVLDTTPPKDVPRKLEEYKTFLTKLNKGFPDRQYKWEEIQSLVPTTEKEFSTYYELTYPDYKNLKFFEAIDSKVFEYAKSDKGDIFFLALNMAQFTDGEYAGSYSAGIEDAVSSNKEKFCIMYKYLSKNSKFRLEPLHKKVCLGIERSEDDEY